MKNIISILFISSFFFCCQQKNKNKTFEVLDTTKIISEANIQEFISKVPDSLKSFLETKNLTYIAYACDCPNFVLAASRDSIGQYHEQYYIEPASKNLIIPDDLCYSGNEFEFQGILTQKHGFPKYSRFEDPNPHAGEVFTYWSYKIKRPFKFWGPKHNYIDKFGDTITDIASEIEVK